MLTINAYRLLALCGFFLAYTPAGSAADEGPTSPLCNRPGIQNINIPMLPRTAAPERMNHKFFVQRGTTDPTTVVIVIPGGPGEDLMLSSSLHGYRLAKRSYILTGVRGVGCNQQSASELPVDFYSSEMVARDILAIAKWALNYGGFENYVLIGQSYGTQVATIAAAFATKEGVKAPEAVIIDGAVANARRDEYVTSVSTEWNELVNNVFPHEEKQLGEALAQFDKLLKTDPRGPITEGVIWLLRRFMGFGMYSKAIGYAPKYLARALIDHRSDNHQSDFYRALYAFLKAGDPPTGGRKFHQAVACHDYIDYGFYPIKDAGKRRTYQQPYPVLSGARMRVETKEFSFPCAASTIDRPYRSSNYQVTAPIYYLAGKLDSYTPDYEAVQHHDGQRSSSFKEIYRLPLAGHGVLSNFDPECTESILKKVIRGKSIAAEIKACEERIYTIMDPLFEFREHQLQAFMHQINSSLSEVALK